MDILRKALTPLCVALVVGLSSQVHAQIGITNTTTDGTLAQTGATYTIVDVGGSARSVFFAGETTNHTWSWTNQFPEFVSVGVQSLTVTFSAPVPVSDIVFGVNSLSNVGQLTISGGTATLSDFNVTDGLALFNGATGNVTFNTTTGALTTTHADQSIVIGSTSNDTISSFTITANGGGDGYTLFFGTVDGSAATPEPGAITLIASAGFLTLGGIVRRRRLRV